MLNRTETTGKDGYRRVFTFKIDESEFKRFIAKTVIEALMSNFPDETRQTIEKIG